MMQELTDADFRREVVESGRPWAVLFSSPWCGACRKVAPRVVACADKNPGVRFGKVEINASPKTAAENAVLGIPAVLFFRDGAERGRLSGSFSEDDLSRELERIR